VLIVVNKLCRERLTPRNQAGTANLKICAAQNELFTCTAMTNMFGVDSHRFSFSHVRWRGREASRLWMREKGYGKWIGHNLVVNETGLICKRPFACFNDVYVNVTGIVWHRQ